MNLPRAIFFSLLLAGTALGLLVTGPAKADDATEARFHFQRGVDLFKQAKLEDALEQFLISNRLVKNSNAVFNAAKCFEKLGSLNEAFALYSEYLLFNLGAKERADGEAKLKDVEAKVATISVKSLPENVEIFLDRQDLGSWGTTPRIIAVPPGPHTIIFVLPNYYSSEVPVEAIVGQEAKVTAELKPRTGLLKLKGPYEKAELTVDGKEKIPVKIPGEVSLPVGQHELKIEVVGFVPDERAVNVREDEASLVDIVLATLPPPVGTMNVISSPSSALVKIDGKDFGFTPLIKPTPVGSHSILVGSKGLQPWKGKFSLKKDESLFLTVDMVPEGIPKKHWMGQQALWGVAGVLAGAGTVTGITALGTHKQFEEDPSSTLETRGSFLSLVTDAIFAVALVSLVAATVWYLISKRAMKMQSKGEFSYRKAEFAEEPAAPSKLKKGKKGK